MTQSTQAEAQSPDLPDHQPLRDAVCAFAADLSGQPAVRQAMASPAGFDPVVWRRAVDELGLTLVLVPESMGGLGFGPAELAVIATELGAVLFCGPFLGSVLAAACVAALGEPGTEARPGPAVSELAAELTAGSIMTLVTEAFADRAGGDGEAGEPSAAVTAVPSRHPGRVTLLGTARVVVDADPGSLLLVAAATPAGWLIATPDRDAPGLATRRLDSLDLTRRLFTVSFDDTPATVLAEGEPAARALRNALAYGQIALAADCVGLAGACLARVVSHLRERYQFGRPLGSFQALKHTCADLLVQLEVARTALAAASASRSPAQLRLLAAAAKVKAAEAASLIATESIQLTGGIGFTWEHPAHLYYRRAKSNELLLGTPAEHRRALYRLLSTME